MSSVGDDTDLTSLVGPNGRFQRLVTKCFTDPEGNTTWRAAKTFTHAEFLDNFSEGKPTRKANLKNWIKHYNLKDGFEKEQAQQMQQRLTYDPNAAPYSLLSTSGADFLRKRDDIAMLSLQDLSLFDPGARAKLAQQFGDVPNSPLRFNYLGAVLGEPKDVKLKMPMIWTEQVETLWVELISSREDCVAAQILAGPSGIGKSYIALLLALRAYATNLLVLYFPDAGELFDSNLVLKDGDETRAKLFLAAKRKFVLDNADKLTDEDKLSVVSCGDWGSLMKFLNDQRAVVIIDEHGHAYTKIKDQKLEPSNIFPLLMPNSYAGTYKSIRFVFAGSNQAQFEVNLNGTYRRFLRFIVPMTPGDAKLFINYCIQSAQTPTPTTVEQGTELTPSPNASHGHQQGLSAYTPDDYRRYANNIPRQMLLLSGKPSVEVYSADESLEMFRILNLTVDKNDTDLLALLNDMFQTKSFGNAVKNVSFLDLGFMYRKEEGGLVVSYPLCHPATLALLQLWKILRGDSTLARRDRLVTTKTNGYDFELFVWDVLIARIFEGFDLKCRSLGYDKTKLDQGVIVIGLKCHEYFVSSIKSPNSEAGSEEFQKEVSGLKVRVKKEKISIVYKCPVDSYCVDFIVFTPEEDYPIQVSISNLVYHSKNGKEPDMEFLGRGRCSDKKALRLSFTHFLYITTKPDPHLNIARCTNSLFGDHLNMDRWRPSASTIRMVDAEEFIGV